MPLYKWKGISEQGIVQDGTLVTSSYKDLERIIFKEGFALIAARQAYFVNSIRPKLKQAFYFHLCNHLNAHIPLYDSLLLCVANQKNRYFALVITDIARMIAEGTLLSEALRAHGLLEPLLEAVICASERTGSLADALAGYVEYTSHIHEYKSALKSQLLMPVITLIFFIAISVGLFVFIIPLFERYYAVYKAQLPSITQNMIAMSHYAQSKFIIIHSIILLVSSLALMLLKKIHKVRVFYDRLLFKIPLFHHVMLLNTKTLFLTSLSMLIKQHVPLVQSLTITIESMSNSFVKKEIERIRLAIETGASFSAALKDSIYNDIDLVTYIKNAESSGDLACMLDYCSNLSRETLLRCLHYSSTCIQPLMIVLLGIMIGLFIWAIYMPIINLSSIIA